MRLRTQTKNLVIRRTGFAALILFAAVLQNTDGLFPAVFGVRAMLLIPVVVVIGMHERDIPGLFYGLLAGMVWDAFSAGPHSFNALMLMTFGFVCGALIGTIMRNNLMTALLLTAGSVFIYNTLYWLFEYAVRGYSGAFKAYIGFYLPSMVYTTVLMPAIYYAVRTVKNRTA